MPAYVIFDIHVDAPDAYAPYREPAGASVEQYGGRYIARGGAAEVLQGGWGIDPLLVLQVPAMGEARARDRPAADPEGLAIPPRRAPGPRRLVEGPRRP